MKRTIIISLLCLLCGGAMQAQKIRIKTGIEVLKEGVKMLGFMIGLFVGAFIGVCVMCLCNAAAKADEQMKDNIDDKK